MAVGPQLTHPALRLGVRLSGYAATTQAKKAIRLAHKMSNCNTCICASTFAYNMHHVRVNALQRVTRSCVRAMRQCADTHPTCLSPSLSVSLRCRLSATMVQPITCLDVAPGSAGDLCVVGGRDGHLEVMSLHTGASVAKMPGHVMDVTACRFFPSGKVVLSGSSDLSLKIWSAEDGHCAAELRGHSSGVSGLAIVERGRNVICRYSGRWQARSQARALVVLTSLMRQAHLTFIHHSRRCCGCR